MNTTAIFTYIIGIIITFYSFVRYTIVYNDFSQAVLGVGVGLLVIVFAYLFQAITEMNDKLRGLETAFDVMNNKYYQEIERLKKK